MNWHWPQFVYAALIAIGWGVNLARYGQPKKDTYDIVDLVAPLVGVWLLYMGGFWTPGQ